MLRTACFAGFAAVALLAQGGQPAGGGPMLRTKIATGEVAGIRSGSVAAFLGIPYAAPPVGEKRWRPPSAPASWSGVRQATSFGASCAQPLFPNGIGSGTPWTKEFLVDPQSKTSEDCLFVNVWTPAKSASERLPVLFWIHGGGFNQGSGSIAIYNGTGLAASGIVVVNINYRFEVFGFLAHPELTRESAASTSGNYGLEDMIAGLEWVRDNIAAFGGDPSRVTIAGQSAGASAVHNLIASPKATGLFRAAIAESGSSLGGPGMPLARAEEMGMKFMAAAGAHNIAELRAMPAEALLKVDRRGIRFGPIVDGSVVPVGPSEVLRTGGYNDTPILTGYTADEASSSASYGHATQADFTDRLAKTFGEAKDKALALYPASDDAAAGEMSKVLARDQSLAGMYQWAATRLETSRQPIYAYLYTHPEPGPNAAHFGAFHSSEVPYVFATLDRSPGRTFTNRDREISRTMVRYWSNFVKTGDPNGRGLAKWPVLDLSSKQIMELGEHFRARPVLSPAKLELFEAAEVGRGRR